jgi:hypothetical protein
VGFEPWDNSPLLLARSPGPNGPWEKLNYEPKSKNAGIFGDTGAPPWAYATRPDPNLAFTSDGRAWIFFSGEPVTTPPIGTISKAGMVQADVGTGKAIGNAVVLFDPNIYKERPFDGTAELNLISVPGQSDRIFAVAGSPDYPLALLDLPDSVSPTDSRTSADLVRLDFPRGLDAATGISPTILLPPYRWSSDGLSVSANNGGAMCYLASAYLADLTFKVDFTPSTINPTAINTVAHIGGADYNTGPAVVVQIDATRDDPYITAVITGTDNSAVALNSGIIANPGTRYSVVLRRAASVATLNVNGAVTTTATQGALLTGLKEWSLATQETYLQPPRYPFQGTIHSFAVTGSNDADQ